MSLLWWVIQVVHKSALRVCLKSAFFIHLTNVGVHECVVCVEKVLTNCGKNLSFAGVMHCECSCGSLVPRFIRQIGRFSAVSCTTGVLCCRKVQNAIEE